MCPVAKFQRARQVGPSDLFVASPANQMHKLDSPRDNKSLSNCYTNQCREESLN